LEAGLAIHEMQHPMVRAAEAEVREKAVGVAHEIAVGKEQQFDQIVSRPLARMILVRRMARRASRLGHGRSLMSGRLCQLC